MNILKTDVVAILNEKVSKKIAENGRSSSIKPEMDKKQNQVDNR